jgi:CheY-like chemotaxis protein
MLKNWGMRPACASSARQALDMLREAVGEDQPYRILISDVNMPAVDGCTLLQWVRDDPGLAGISVIMLTSGARPGDVQRCEQLGIVARLMKPVIQSELLDAIGMALGVDSALETQEEHAPPAAAESLSSLQILLAEDSLVNQRLAVGLLEKHGHQVTVAEDGRQAIELYEQQPVDVILMDVEMPEMDGLIATGEIRQAEQETGRHIPIIAMTAHAMKGDRERCLEAGMDDYIAKPIRAEELFETLRRVLHK